MKLLIILVILCVFILMIAAVDENKKSTSLAETNQAISKDIVDNKPKHNRNGGGKKGKKNKRKGKGRGGKKGSKKGRRPLSPRTARKSTRKGGNKAHHGRRASKRG